MKRTASSLCDACHVIKVKGNQISNSVPVTPGCEEKKKKIIDPILRIVGFDVKNVSSHDSVQRRNDRMQMEV